MLFTGDSRYLDIWSKQMDTVNAQHKVINGKTSYPHMYGDKGWYHYTPEKYSVNAIEIYYMTMKPHDQRRVTHDPWVAYLQGQNAEYPEQAMRADLDRIRRMAQGMRADKTTPDTRLSDDPMRYAPCSVTSLIHLMLGGLPPGNWGTLLHCRLRYFDPIKRRAGIPEGVAALVEKLTPDSVTVMLVNTDQIHDRRLVVQAGAYAEHQFLSATVHNATVHNATVHNATVHNATVHNATVHSVTADGRTVPVDAPCFEVHLAAGAGSRLTLRMKRYANRPTLTLPWDRARKFASGGK
jgi:hypothetical protein